MAGIRSAIVTDAAGSIGGAALQRSASGLIMRAKRRPSNPQTPRQIAQRAETSFLASTWPGISESERLAWNNLAQDVQGRTRFGDRLKYSGMNLFMKANLNARLVGATTLISSPKTSSPIFPPTLQNITIDVSEKSLTLTGALPSGWRLAVFASRPVSSGRKSAAVAFIESFTTLGSGNSANFSISYHAKYGADVTTGKVTVEAVLINPTTGERITIGKQTSVFA